MTYRTEHDPAYSGIEAAEAFRLIGHHFERAADLLELGRADEAKYHYERGGKWAATLLDGASSDDDPTAEEAQ